MSLKGDVVMYINRDIIRKVSFLRELGEECILVLVPRLKLQICTPGEIVIKKDMFGQNMYLCSEGELDMVVPGGGSRIQLKKGDYFAEYAIILDNARHPATVEATAFCDLFSLHKSDMDEVGKWFPHAYHKVVEMGKARFKELLNVVAEAGEIETKTLKDPPVIDEPMTGRHARKSFGSKLRRMSVMGQQTLLKMGSFKGSVTEQEPVVTVESGAEDEARAEEIDENDAEAISIKALAKLEGWKRRSKLKVYSRCNVRGDWDG